MKTIVIGLGNPILGDDGVGWKVAEKICRQLSADETIVVDCVSVGGIGLMEHLIGYDRAILIDAFISNERVGSISVLRLGDLPNYSAYHITGAHDTSLQNAMEFGRAMGAHLPEDVIIVGIAIKQICDFSERLSPAVALAASRAVKIVLDLVRAKVTF